jgi:fructose-1,6-bisphosphatase/inositol monophosphatase family enzyme
MRAILKEAAPDDTIIGEEFGSTPGTSGRSWVLDPIDGTSGFLAGAPFSAR